LAQAVSTWCTSDVPPMKFLLLLATAYAARLRATQHKVTFAHVRAAVGRAQAANFTGNFTPPPVMVPSEAAMPASPAVPVPAVADPGALPPGWPNETVAVPEAVVAANVTTATNATNATNGTVAIVPTTTAAPTEPPSMDLPKGSSVPAVPPPLVLKFCGDPIAHACYVWTTQLIQCYSQCDAPGADPTAKDFGGCVSACQLIPPAICGHEDVGGMCTLDDGSVSATCDRSCANFEKFVIFGDCSKKRSVQEYTDCFDTNVLETTPGWHLISPN